MFWSTSFILENHRAGCVHSKVIVMEDTQGTDRGKEKLNKTKCSTKAKPNKQKNPDCIHIITENVQT